MHPLQPHLPFSQQQNSKTPFLHNTFKGTMSLTTGQCSTLTVCLAVWCQACELHRYRLVIRMLLLLAACTQYSVWQSCSTELWWRLRCQLNGSAEASLVELCREWSSATDSLPVGHCAAACTVAQCGKGCVPPTVSVCQVRLT